MMSCLSLAIAKTLENFYYTNKERYT